MALHLKWILFQVRKWILRTRFAIKCKTGSSESQKFCSHFLTQIQLNISLYLSLQFHFLFGKANVLNFPFPNLERPLATP